MRCGQHVATVGHAELCPLWRRGVSVADVQVDDHEPVGISDDLKNDLALGMALVGSLVGIGCLGEREDGVDAHAQAAGVDQVCQFCHLGSVGVDLPHCGGDLQVGGLLEVVVAVNDRSQRSAPLEHVEEPVALGAADGINDDVGDSA